MRHRLERARIGDPALIASASLLVSELVTNAVTHGDGREVAVDVRFDGALHVGVTDRSPDAPVMRKPVTLDTHGRGLRMVAAVADGWGFERAPAGKSVWFTLRPAGGPR